MATGTLAVLAAVLGIPAISQIFSFSTPLPLMLLAAAGVAALSLIWFEVVKQVLSKLIPMSDRQESTA